MIREDQQNKDEKIRIHKEKYNNIIREMQQQQK